MNLRKKVKGFTLVELLVVLAILTVLAGVSSIAIVGFIRDARIETANDRARIIFSAVQEMVTECEMKQDNSVFEPRGLKTGFDAEKTNDIVGAIIFFRICERDFEGYRNKNGNIGLGDEIHIMTTHSTPVTHSFGAGPNMCSMSVWMEGSTNPNKTNAGYGGCNADGDHGASYWKKFDKYIGGRIDTSMEGTYVVSVDLTDYQVLSVITRDVVNGWDPKTGLYDGGEVSDGKPLCNYINNYDTQFTAFDGTTVTLPQRTFLIKDIAQEKDISDRKGITVGCYPLGDTLYSNVTAKTFT